MKRTTFLALAMSLGLVMNAGQAGATVANPGLAAAAANAKQTTPVTQVWWRGGGYGPGWHGGWRGGYGPGWRGGWRPGYGWRSGYGWVPFAAFGAAAAATGAYYYNRPYYGPGPYNYGPGPSYGPCGAVPCDEPPLK
jgi:hypothetical protein